MITITLITNDGDRGCETNVRPDISWWNLAHRLNDLVEPYVDDAWTIKLEGAGDHPWFQPAVEAWVLGQRNGRRTLLKGMEANLQQEVSTSRRWAKRTVGDMQGTLAAIEIRMNDPDTQDHPFGTRGDLATRLREHFHAIFAHNTIGSCYVELLKEVQEKLHGMPETGCLEYEGEPNCQLIIKRPVADA